jgi:hypothetical protein
MLPSAVLPGPLPVFTASLMTSPGLRPLIASRIFEGGALPFVGTVPADEIAFAPIEGVEHEPQRVRVEFAVIVCDFHIPATARITLANLGHAQVGNVVFAAVIGQPEVGLFAQFAEPEMSSRRGILTLPSNGLVGCATIQNATS